MNSAARKGAGPLVLLAALVGCAAPSGPDGPVAGVAASAPGTGAGARAGAGAAADGPSDVPSLPPPGAGTRGPGAGAHRTSPPPSRGPGAAAAPSGRPGAADSAPPAPTRSSGSSGSLNSPRNGATTGAGIKPPDLSRTAPPSGGGSGETTLSIGSWSARVVRGGQVAVDACRDAVQWAGPDLGTENGYEMRTAVVVGHDYCGFQQFATLAVGTAVTVTSPRGTFRYRVYANYVTPGRGTPAHGLYWGDLTLQSCVGQDTGFSYLTRE